MNTFSESGRFDRDWQIDLLTGKRFRMVGNIMEYEPTTLVNGIEIPDSQLADFNRRSKEEEDRRKAAAAEKLKNLPEPKNCPFMDGMNDLCRREKCKIFIKGKCSIAVLADSAGVTIEETPTTGAKCPFSVYGNCNGCALFNGGCAIVRLASAAYKE